MVARDWMGRSLDATTSSILQVQSPWVVEAMAFRWVIFLAVDLGFTKVHFETDCYLLYEAWKRNDIDVSYFGVLIRECSVISRAFTCFNLSFVRLYGNMTTDCMTRLTFDHPGRVWVEDVPENLNSILDSDLLQ